MIRKVRDECGLIAAYREGLGLAAIAIVWGAGGPRVLSVAADAPPAAPAAQDAPALWWCRSAADAARIAAAATRTLRRESNRQPRQADEAAARSHAIAAVVAAADRLAVVLQSDDEVAADAMSVAARIDATLQQRQKSGGLKAINSVYRAHRLDSSAHGGRILRYGEWMENYKKSLIRQAAFTLRQI